MSPLELQLMAAVRVLDEEADQLRADNRAMTEKNTTLQRHLNERTMQLSETQDELKQWKDTATRLGNDVASLEDTIKRQRDGLRLSQARRQPEPATVAAPAEVREEPHLWQFRWLPSGAWTFGSREGYWAMVDGGHIGLEVRAIWWDTACR